MVSQTESIVSATSSTWFREQSFHYLTYLRRNSRGIGVHGNGQQLKARNNHNLLTNCRNRLVGQTVHSLLCLGDWISAGIIMNKDIVRAVSGLPDIEGDDEVEMEAGWDRILK